MIRSSAELHRRFIMDKANLQQIAEIRVRDAEVLLAAGQWDAAYYLPGYSIECALKACISKQFDNTKYLTRNQSMISTRISLMICSIFPE